MTLLFGNKKEKNQMAGGPSFGFPPRVPLSQHLLAKSFGAMLWFWVFWRAKEDGPALLGFRYPWDHHGHGHEHDAHHDSHNDSHH